MSKRASLVAVLSCLLIFGFFTTTAFGQCTLSGPVSSWNDGTGNWSNGGDWTGGVPNSSTQSVCITNGTMGAPSVVNLDINASINNLQLGTFDTLNFDPGTTLSVFGTQIINAGQINMNSGGGANAALELENNVTLSGNGTLTLANTGGGGTAFIYQAVGGLTLTNQSTIQGAGTIGFNGLSLINQGTVNANTSGQTLEFSSMTNGINNTGGLLAASNGGLLYFDGITVTGGGTLTASGGGTVQLVAGTDIVGGTLNNTGGTLGTLQSGTATLDGSTAAGAITINGTYTNGLGSTTSILGTINNNNSFLLNAGGGANSTLELGTNVTLQGGGTVIMSEGSGGGTAIIYQAVGGLTLTNVNNTIEGAGTIGFNGLTVVNEAIINANSSGQTLELVSMTGGLTNTGKLEASNGGTLFIDGVTVNNAGGGTITANAGSTVQLVGSTMIQGGTLTNNGSFFGTPDGNTVYLDGSTAAGAITINGTYTNGVGSATYILGTINNNNLIQLNAGGGSNSVLLIDSANLTLQGGGTVTMSNSGGGGDAIIYQAVGGETLTNVNNTIQGTGIIGFNGLTVVNEATINANVSGQTLTLESMTGGLTNTGKLEASNGGTLFIDGVTVNNAGGGTITANAGSTVQLVGSTMIQGGTLTNNGVFFGTPDGNTAYLDGSTAAGAITINGTYTNGNGSATYLLGTINNNNSFLVTATGNGNNSDFIIDSANVMLQGGGTVTLSTASGGGTALIDQESGGFILTNVNNTIQGEGIIGLNGLTLINEAGGTINANSMGGSQITTLTIESATVTNQGLMEATNNGTLFIDGVTINNQGGTIAANGAGATLQLVGETDIKGGTLTNNGGAFFGTPNGNAAILDGSTAAGAVTINGTYTNGNNSTTFLLGTINNQGNILLNGGSGNNSDLEIFSAKVTLTGGGTVTLSTAGGGGNAIIFQASGGFTLENFNNTIQGAGLIGDNGLSLMNDAKGTVLANVSGGTLDLTGIATLTNNGTFQANAGSTLLVGNVGTFTNFSGNTLTGGTWNVFGTMANPGTIQLNPLGNTGGEIVNNAATILLDGPDSNFVDAAGKDALSNFSNNTATGSFTIQDGRNFTSSVSTDFTNAGIVNIGAGSTFTTPGANNYTQTGGSTQLDGTLTAGGHASVTGGVLFGNGGIINGNVTMGGTIVPAATINSMTFAPITAGQLTINGNYTQNGMGVFNLGLGGTTAGTQFGLLTVNGTATLGGTLNVSLINGFFPTNGDIFKFLTTSATVSGEFATVNGLNIGGGEVLDVVYGSNFVELTTMALTNTDNWLGGTGTWSTAAKWSIGVPTPPDNVFIYSGGNDLVTLNVGSTTINSLAVGGATNGFTSELTDGGVAQTLTITNGLTIGQQGVLDFTGNGSIITAATVTNDGAVTIGKGATLNLTGQPNGVTDVVAGSSWTIGGNFEVGGVANTGFANLASIEGSVILENGQSQTIGNALAVASTGLLDLENGTTLHITGDVTNNSTGFGHGIYTSFNGGSGGNTLTISGMLTNSGAFELRGSGDMASIGNGVLNNSGGLIDVANGSTLNITGNVTNNGTLASTFFNPEDAPGNTLNITGNLTNNSGAGFGWLGAGDQGGVTGNVINNGGITVLGSDAHTFGGTLTNNAGAYLDIDNQSTLHITGNVTNSAGGTFGDFGIYVDAGNFGSTLTIGGSLTNSGNFFVGDLALASVANGATNDAGGLIDVEGGGTLNITGDVSNAGTIQTNFAGSGGNNTITITGMLTNSGTFQLNGPADFASIGNGLTNSGTVDLENGSTLAITGNSSNSGDFYTDFSGGGGNNTVTITGTLDNTGLVWLKGAGDKATISGAVTNELDAELFLFGGSKATMPGLTNAGTVDVEGGSTLQVNGDASNSGNLYTNQQGSGGGNSINITGTLTNSGNFELFGPADTATLGGLSNSGTTDVEHGSTLQINGNASNSGDLYTDNSGLGGNNTVNITGTLDNTGLVWLKGAGDKATITGLVTNELDAEIFLFGGSKATMNGGLNNAGTVDVEGGSTLQVNGGATNSGNLYTNQQGAGGNNVVNITGMLTNSGTFQLNGPGDMASIGNGVTNSGTINVVGGSTLSITGDVTNNGTMATTLYFVDVGGNTMNITGNLTNNFDFGWLGSGDQGTITGNVSNNGASAEFVVYGGATGSIGGNLTNSGLVDVELGSTLNVGGNVTNSGTLETNALLGAGGGNTITVNGLLTNEAAGLIQLNGPGDVLKALAGLSNSGVINVNNGSSIDPPFFNNLGTLNIDGTSRFVVGTPTPMGGQGYIQTANGLLGEMISSTNFGVINVNGSALLDGTLAILLQGGFNPSVGSTYKFLNFSSGQLSGIFANIENDIFNNGTEKWFVDYENGGGYVELIAEPNQAPVSEPATLLVLIPGLLGMGYGLRRRLSK